MTFDPLTAIAAHSAALAEAATDHLGAAVEHCPGWTVADLVAHVTDVHWFWATIVGESLSTPPDPDRRPARLRDSELIGGLRAGAVRLIEVLGAADPGTPVWTWAPGRAHVAFVQRHQVQEAAVHHFDAAHAAGLPWTMDPSAAADAVEEFLSVSVSSDADPADPAPPGLGGSFCLQATDVGSSWTVAEGSSTGTVRWTPGAAGPTVAAPAADLLLWLYRRRSVSSDVSSQLLDRFRVLTFTD